MKKLNKTWKLFLETILVTIFLVSTIFNFGCTNEVQRQTDSQENSEIGNLQNEVVECDKVSLDFVIDSNTNVNLSFCEYECDSELIDFCNKYYGDTVISESNLVLEIVKSSDHPYLDSSLELMLALYPDMDRSVIEDYINRYDSYIQSQPEEYRVSLYLTDDIGKYEIRRWYFSKGTAEMTKDEFRYWMFGELGAKIWPLDIFKDYIVWEYNLYPCGNYCPQCDDLEGDEKIKCGLAMDIEAPYEVRFK